MRPAEPARAPHRGALGPLTVLGLGFAFMLAACGGAGVEAPSARAIEARLMAPCCWVGTLEDHESPLATTLRSEIERRFAGGEAATSIEDDLALRYGERVRAVPKGGDPRGGLMLGAGLAVAAAFGALVVTLRRWARSSSAASASTATANAAPRPRDVYDDRIDDELARLDA